MRVVTIFETADTKRHETFEGAIKHLEARYADVLLPTAHKLATMSPYKAAEWIDANLSTFTDLVALKAEMQFVEPSQED
jgi:hypothetical protein